MSRVSDVLRKTTSGYAAYCPGCKEIHIFDARWQLTNGETNRPTFSPSLLVRCPGDRTDLQYPDLMPPECCHSFVVAGNWQFLSDCTHELANQTVPMVHCDNWWQCQDDPTLPA